MVFLCLNYSLTSSYITLIFVAMQRGKQRLYNNIVPRSIVEAGEKGQRNTGIEARRNAMAHRYYFHCTINRLRYDDCLLNLQQEFFLQPDTIVKELLLRSELIANLVNERATTAELRKMYPFFNWISRLV